MPWWKIFAKGVLQKETWTLDLNERRSWIWVFNTGPLFGCFNRKKIDCQNHNWNVQRGKIFTTSIQIIANISSASLNLLSSTRIPRSDFLAARSIKITWTCLKRIFSFYFFILQNIFSRSDKLMDVNTSRVGLLVKSQKNNRFGKKETWIKTYCYPCLLKCHLVPVNLYAANHTARRPI